MDKNICSVIVSYNSPEKLQTCIDSSIEQTDKVVVVDNNSGHNIKSVIAGLSYPEKVLFIFNEENAGLGAAFNQGIRYSLEHGYEWTLLLDQDSVLSKNMVHEMLHSYDNLEPGEKEQTALLVPRIFDRNLMEELPPVVTSALFNKKIKDPDGDCFIHFHLTSGNLVKNRAVEKIGFMNEIFFIDYIDFDYCFRFLNNGFKILLSRKAFLEHSLGEKRYKMFMNFREHSPIRVYYQTRNRLFIVFKYGKKFKSVLYSEIYRFISKLPKILILETGKAEKTKMYFKGIIDFFKDYKKLNKEV